LKQSRAGAHNSGLGLSEETGLFGKGFDLVAGIDEVGRGPVAGPVVAAAVAAVDLAIMEETMDYILNNVNDSKKVAAKKRAELYRLITKNNNFLWATASVSNTTIDKINILRASKLAMKMAVAKLAVKARVRGCENLFCLVDGNFAINIGYRQKSIIGGDGKVFSIAAASIIAKVKRDRTMRKFDKKYPGYGFAENKGYPTKVHIAAIESLGLSPIHRLSYRPCGKIIKKI